MDIYSFFYSHHNPKIKNKALRQQELLELTQVVLELNKALTVAKRRSELASKPPYLPEHFIDIQNSLEKIYYELSNLAEAHPGDSQDDIKEMIDERKELPSWQNWSNLIKEFNERNKNE